MDIAGVREALHKEPFDRFVIRLAALTPRRVIVGAEDDSWTVVEPLLIVSLDYGGKGKGRADSSKNRRNGS